MKRNLYILLTLFAVLLAGCEHKDFCCRCLQADDVEVVFDWSRSPDADPASMKVYFFPEGGGEALVYEFADIHGGSIRLPAGNYRAVCVNSDTEFLHYEHTDRFDSIRAFTGGGVSGQLPGTDGEEFRNAPDPRNVHIVLDGLTLPKPLANGSGFRPTVDDWQEVEVPLRM